MIVRNAALRAKEASRSLAGTPYAVRKEALLLAAEALERDAPDILTANALDVVRADAEGVPMPLLKRLKVNEAKLREIITGIRAVAELPDPLGKTQMAKELAEGLDLYRVSCPIGVVGVVFESRPDALTQIGSLCVLSGNAVLLKGGWEARETNREMFNVMDAAARLAGLPAGWGTLLETREDVKEMLSMDDCIDLIVPRGSNAFVRHIKDNSRIPVLGHADGICHVYVDAEADIGMAKAVVVDSKAQYVAVCNAAERLLVHKKIAEEALPVLAEALKAARVTLRGCPLTREIIACEPAEDADWDTEYLDYILAVKVVDTLDEAIDHINNHGSGHTDAIVTENREAAKAFLARVDSAGVFHNCSTRFADGYRYGFGAEVGISTGKIHARGPMGIEGLCTYKYKLLGHGQTVGGNVIYTHRPLERDCPLEA